MDNEILGIRRKGLEEAFFDRLNKDLARRLRERLDYERRLHELKETTGIDDEEVLDELAKLEVGAETMTALSLIPLLAVAWADGKVQDSERAALLEAAAQAGVEKGGPGWEMFETWLENEPNEGLFDAWKDYVDALHATCSDDSRAALKAEVLGWATRVARAAGGILGVGSVLGSEKLVLEKIEAAFDV